VLVLHDSDSRDEWIEDSCRNQPFSIALTFLDPFPLGQRLLCRIERDLQQSVAIYALVAIERRVGEPNARMLPVGEIGAGAIDETTLPYVVDKFRGVRRYRRNMVTVYDK
jgi:hypothetical protein